MGMSYADAVRCGVGHLHPDHPDNREDTDMRRRKATAFTLDADPKAKKPRITGKNELGQNKTEAAWDRHLADLKTLGKIRDYWFEPIKIRLAGNTTYRVDFLVRRLDRTLAAIEIKGFMRDDAAVKIKVAAEQCTWADFYLVQKAGKEWDIRYVGRNGIGRDPIVDDFWALEE